MKLIGPIAIALIGCLIFLLFEGFILNVFISTHISIRTVAKEMFFIEGLNKVESVKLSLPYALYYSYITTLMNMGYKSYEEVEDKSSFLSNFTKSFYIYKDELEKKNEVSIPTSQIEIKEENGRIKIVFSPSKYLLYEGSSSELKFKIYDISNVSIIVSSFDNTLLEIH